jgi:hypothetical protein
MYETENDVNQTLPFAISAAKSSEKMEATRSRLQKTLKVGQESKKKRQRVERPARIGSDRRPTSFAGEESSRSIFQPCSFASAVTKLMRVPVLLLSLISLPGPADQGHAATDQPPASARGRTSAGKLSCRARDIRRPSFSEIVFMCWLRLRSARSSHPCMIPRPACMTACP